MIVLAAEALIDLAPEDGLLRPLPGGSPYNIAVGIGRLGGDATFLGGLSTDGFGQLLAQRLRDDGVGLDLVSTTDVPTTLAVVHLDDEARASYGFYLDGTSAAGLTTAALPTLPDGAALHVSFGALTLDTDPAGATLADLLGRERGRRLRSIDPNVRPSVIADLAGYATRMDLLAAEVDLVKVSDEDLSLLHPGRPPIEVARGWATSGPALVVMTRGADGAIALRDGRPDVGVPGVPVEVVDTVGAGDAFTAGLLTWLDRRHLLTVDGLAGLDDDDLAEALRQAAVVAAMTCGRAGADPPRAGDLSG